MTYQTSGITWWSDYNLILSDGKDANSGVIDLSAWVSIVNQSGATYPDAKLKLVAGDVNRAVAPAQAPGVTLSAQRATQEANDGFKQKAFFEFHLYTLGRPTTLQNNSTKQVELFDRAQQVPAKQSLIYEGFASAFVPYEMGRIITDRSFGPESNKKVDVYLEFRNARQYGLGIPLPAGRIRVSKLDPADGSLEFIGEDLIDHTAKDEPVRVRLGSAFDVVGERRQIDFAVDSKAKWLEEEFEIKIRNHKELPVEVRVREPLYRAAAWKVVSNSAEFRKDDGHNISFMVRVARDGEQAVRYRVRYTW